MMQDESREIRMRGPSGWSFTFTMDNGFLTSDTELMKVFMTHAWECQVTAPFSLPLRLGDHVTVTLPEFELETDMVVTGLLDQTWTFKAVA